MLNNVLKYAAIFATGVVVGHVLTKQMHPKQLSYDNSSDERCAMRDIISGFVDDHVYILTQKDIDDGIHGDIGKEVFTLGKIHLYGGLEIRAFVECATDIMCANVFALDALMQNDIDTVLRIFKEMCE